nr:immunoglobulin light chain junction region [Macaca mulatta]MOV95995.1 immunoglobulin light chain junction region [Macaca mulatta]MOV96011.1 immunoglobulin light chain junction region [Macaca mulatta]MOV96668.1 immunoglobulin light chain junction region [Macaca mulatta]MOV98092.1 immunoglobulin light chain junction region [Macaca mulatta]
DYYCGAWDSSLSAAFF